MMDDAWAHVNLAQDSGHESVPIAASRMGGFWVAMDSARIVSVGQSTEPHADLPQGSIDLATYLDLPLAGAPRTRRTLTMSTERGPLTLMVGSDVWIRTVPVTLLRSTPKFLEIVGQHFALMGLIQLRGDFAFILNLDDLATQVAEAKLDGAEQP